MGFLLTPVKKSTQNMFIPFKVHHKLHLQLALWAPLGIHHHHTTVPRCPHLSSKAETSMFDSQGDWLVLSFCGEIDGEVAFKTCLVGGFNGKNISQIGSFPQVRMKIKNIWNHHLVLKQPVKEVILLMVQKSGDHQLRLVVEIPFFTRFGIHPRWFFV